MEIFNIEEKDYPEISRIYLEGIATGQATFQTEAPSWNDWDNSHCRHSRIVAKNNNEVIGWAALTPVSNRCVYAGVAEVSVYVSSTHKGNGIGSKLLKALIDASEANGIWTLQAGIFPENQASIHLHKKFGFRIIGIREKIGQMNGVWRNTTLMERRSKTTGI